MNWTIQLSDIQAAIIWNILMVAAIFLAFIVQYREGRRRGFEPLSWITLLAVVYSAMLLGERLGAFTANDWRTLIYNGGLPDHVGKTAVGGAMLALPAFFLLRKWFRLPGESVDVFWVPVLLAAAISRIGCFFSGCCFGTLSGSDWGVCYGPGTSAYAWQQAQGLIAADAGATLPLVPVQLFITTFGLLAFFVLWRIRHRFLHAGSLGWLTLGAMAANRFMVEFFREPAASRGIIAATPGGLLLTQWLCLTLIALAVFACWYNEQRKSPAQEQVQRNVPMLIRTGLLLVATLSILIFSKILTLEERVILILIVSPTLYNLAKAIRQEWERTSHTLVSVGFLSASGIALILMPLDTLVPSDPAEVLQMQSDSSILKINPYYVQGQKGKRWVDVGFSGTLGNYERRVVTKDCDGNITSDKRHKVKIQNATLDASYNIGLNEGRFGFGFRGITGMSEARTFPDEDFAFQAINPYIALDKRKMGFSIGVMAFIYNYEKPSHEDFLPSLYLRIGKIDKVHFDFSFFQNAGWLAYPEPSFYSSLNYGFGDLSGAKNLQIGLMSSADDDATGAGFLLGFRHPLGSTPLLVDCTLQLKKYIMASLGLRYRFNLPPQKGISK